jgi:hypothetical protein
VRRVIFTYAELVALREAVRAIPWMSLDRSGYFAVRSVERKLDRAVVAAERSRSGQLASTGSCSRSAAVARSRSRAVGRRGLQSPAMTRA